VVTSVILGLHLWDLYTRIHVKSRLMLLQAKTVVPDGQGDRGYQKKS
jgi:hypothetical protein